MAFPTSPSVNDQHTHGGFIYIWDGNAWKRATATAYQATDITFTPTGDVSATNVQNAVAEVDSEKLALAGGTMTGILNGTQFKASEFVLIGSYAGSGNYPAAAGNAGAVLIDTTLGSGRPVYSDGVNWRRMNNNNIII
jgi:hypothetical protein